MSRKLQIYLKALRPIQWSKNLVVLVAPFASGTLLSLEHPRRLFLVFFSFCLASSVNYVVNDWLDREFDSKHSYKFKRPFASRQLGRKDMNLILTVLIVCLAVILSFLPPSVNGWIVAYLLFSLTYSFFLKRIAVIELFVVSLGFVFRSFAGAQAVQVVPSAWFTIVIGFGALFLVANKRNAEVKFQTKLDTREVISQYSSTFLGVLIGSSMAMTQVSFSLWAFQYPDDSFARKICTIFFNLALVRYFWIAQYKNAEFPEIFLFKDKVLVMLELIVLLLISYSLYIEDYFTWFQWR